MLRRVLGRWVRVVFAATIASPAMAQTQAEGRARGPSSDLNTENRQVIDEDTPRRYEVYDPGAGYGRDLYLNDQYFLRGTRQREPSAQPNRTGIQPRRDQRAGDAGEPESAVATQRIRGEVVRMQTAPAADDRPLGAELVMRLVDGTDRAFWLGDDVYVAAHLPPLSTGDRVTVVGQPVNGDGESRFEVRWVETPTGRFQSPFYRFNEAVEAKLVSTRRQPAEGDAPEALVGTLELPDGRQVEMGLGPAAAIAARGVTPREGATVRIEGYLRSSQSGGWSFVVQDVKVDGESVRKPADEPEAQSEPE